MLYYIPTTARWVALSLTFIKSVGPGAIASVLKTFRLPFSISSHATLFTILAFSTLICRQRWSAKPCKPYSATIGRKITDRTASSAANQLRSPLLRLPGEIRNRIYGFTFCGEDNFENALLKTCKQIEHEAKPI